MLPLSIDPDRFSKRTRSRGDDYYADGCVDLVEFSGNTISAIVHGTLSYSVRLKLRETTRGASVTSFSCTCPQFLRAGECKHVWATVRAVQGLEEDEDEDFSDSDFTDDAEWEIFDPLLSVRSDDSPLSDFVDSSRFLPDHRERRAKRTSRARPEPPSFDDFFDSAKELLGDESAPAAGSRFMHHATGESEIVYQLHDPRGAEGPGSVDSPVPGVTIPMIDVLERRRGRNGWGKLRPLDIKGRHLDAFLSGDDRRWVETLMRLDPEILEALRYHWPGSCTLTRMALESELGRRCLLEIAEAGRLFPKGTDPETAPPISFDSTPFDFSLAIVPIAHVVAAGEAEKPEKKPKAPPPVEADYTLMGHFRPKDRPSDAPPITLDSVRAVFDSGLVWVEDRLHALSDRHAIRWIALALRAQPTLPAGAVTDSVLRLLEFDPAIPLELPPELELSIVRSDPKPRLVVRKEKTPGGRSALRVLIYFDYGDGVILTPEDETGAVLRGTDCLARQLEAENARIVEVLSAGARRSVKDTSLGSLTLSATRLPHLVDRLLPLGWAIEAEGRAYHQATEIDIAVQSGIDWLDVDGTARFENEVLPFPRLLGALRRGNRLVPLGDGSVGVLPHEWLRRAGALAAFGELDGDEVRFRPEQAWFLDALLAEIPDVDADAKFAEIREKIAAFDGISPLRERRSFQGKLRPYQREALGWLRFLRELEMGGCLADDMGLGKTVQIIAHLESLRLDKSLDQPVLVVAPRSVIENWQRELARFAPRLTVLDASGPGREELYPLFPERHVVLMTYALVRSDIEQLKDQQFDTVILDEAQAIKNGSSQTAKSVRLLRAKHRLALSGTPIENHIGELWSLFEFLQPGSLGRARRFAAVADELAGEERAETKATATPPAAPPTGDSASIAGTVRPFILRRTKAQVAPELPPRTEQIIECPLTPRQRALYDELHAHFQNLLRPADESPEAGKRRQHGVSKFGKSPLLVLRALLRLRQASCHPALLDPERSEEGSGKLDVLLERVGEIRDNGQKCLIFSQFTRFLDLVRGRLDALDIASESLDGKTRDRQGCVDRFQNDPERTAFLISLKAGGVGLNLTAADYVFLLDPWWNPAAEAQAIDRAHRIGRTGPVIAYKLIAPGTVEEKVLELQSSKRALADAIIREDDGWLGKLTAEDLGQLFS